MKKNLALILAFIMLFSLTSVAFAADEPEELRFMFIGGGDASPKETIYREIVEEFNATNPYNVKIVVETCDDPTYKTKVPTLMTQNNMADIFWTWGERFLQPYVEAGKVYCLDDALASDEELASRFTGEILDSATYDGKVYGLVHSNCTYPTYYNKAIFEECGVEVPTTWDEFINLCQTLIDKGITPFAMGGQDAWVMAQFLTRLVCGVGGVDLYNKIRYNTGTWEDEGFIEAGTLLQELIDMGIFEENFAGVSYNEAMAMFCDGKTAMYHMGTWVTGELIEGFGKENADNIGVFYVPNVYEKNAGSNLAATDDIICIAETCKNKEAALAFLKMFSNVKWQEKLFIEAGLFPAVAGDFDKEKIDPVSLALIDISTDMSPIGPFDVLLGANIGNEYNNVAVAISTGSDPAEQFAHLQEFVEFEAD